MRKSYTLLLIIIISSFFQTLGLAQHTNPNKKVYWFNISVRITKDAKTGAEKYSVRRIGKKVTVGKMSDYDYQMWNGMRNGNQLTVGPFISYDEAFQAMLLYDLATVRKENSEINYNEGTTYYWFLIKIKIMKRDNSYQFERMAAAVASGSKRQFEDVLWEGLSFMNIAIGPFSDAIDAEEAKRIYRLEE